MRRWWIAAVVAVAIAGCDSREKARPAEEASATTRAAPTTESTAEPEEPAVEPTHVLVLEGEFTPGPGDPSGLPDDSPQKSLADIEVPREAAEQLNSQSKMIVEQVVRRHEVEPVESGEGLPTLVVTLGEKVGVDPKRPMTHTGLLVKVDLRRVDGTHRAASRQIPPATSAGELMANLDHTLNTLVQMVLETSE